MGILSGDDADPAETTESQFELAERIALLADRAGADTAAASIRQAGRRARSSAARVCIVGGTNVGKSSLINRLVGAECVPVSVQPIVTGPTVVQSATVRSAAAASSRQAPGTSGYKTVTVSGDTDLWLTRAGLELVDTPSWEVWTSQDPALTDPGPLSRVVTDCDLVVVATEARRALPVTDQARLRALVSQQHSPPVVVVVTKLDEVGDEADEVMRRVRYLARETAPEIQVLPGPADPRISGYAERLEQCRSALAALSGAHHRVGLRAVRRIHLLTATCELIADAAERALADAHWSDPKKARAAQVWQAARESAQFNWIVLAAALDDRRETLVARIRAETERRRVQCIASLAAELSEATTTRLFMELRVIPQIDIVRQELQAWIAEAVSSALSDAAGWLRDALLRNRPGEELFAGLTGPHVHRPVPLVAGTASPAHAAADPDGWEASWLPEFVGTALESVLAPVISETIAHLVGAVGTAVVGEAVQHGQDRRLRHTVDALRQLVTSAFVDQLARAEDHVEQEFRRLAGRAQDRDEQWWRLHSAALAAQPESVEHWRTLLAEAHLLRRSARIHLSSVEGR